MNNLLTPHSCVPYIASKLYSYRLCSIPNYYTKREFNSFVFYNVRLQFNPINPFGQSPRWGIQFLIKDIIRINRQKNRNLYE